MKKNISKIIVIILILCFVFPFVSCNSSDSGDLEREKKSKPVDPSKIDYSKAKDSLMYVGDGNTRRSAFLIFDDNSKTSGMIFYFDDYNMRVENSHFSVLNNGEKNTDLDKKYSGLSFSQIVFDDEAFESYFWFACGEKYYEFSDENKEVAIFDYIPRNGSSYEYVTFYKADKEDIKTIQTWFKAQKDGKIKETHSYNGGTKLLDYFCAEQHG